MSEEKHMSGISTLLFDIDGTLLDSKPFLAKTFHSIIERYYPGTFAYEQVICYFRTGLWKLLRDANMTDYQPILDEFHRTKELRYHEQSLAFPGVVPALKQMKANGYRLAVISNQRRNPVVNSLRINGVETLFDAVVAFEDVSEVKPSPEGILKVLRQIGVEPAAAAMIGDSEDDIMAARRAGTAAVLLNWYSVTDLTCDEPDFAFDNIEQLLHALKMKTLQ